MKIVERVKNLLPIQLIRFVKRLPLQLQSKEKIFTNYYKKNKWGDATSRSGTGSSLNQTVTLREAIANILAEYQIKTFLDIPCGDFNWLQKVKLEADINYVGADIVQILVDKNNNLYSRENIHFVRLDITKDSIPLSDLVMVRAVSYTHLTLPTKRIV